MPTTMLVMFTYSVIFTELNYSFFFFLSECNVRYWCSLLRYMHNHNFPQKRYCCKTGGKFYSYSHSALPINKMSVQVSQCDDDGDNNN